MLQHRLVLPLASKASVKRQIDVSKAVWWHWAAVSYMVLPALSCAAATASAEDGTAVQCNFSATCVRACFNLHTSVPGW